MSFTSANFEIDRPAMDVAFWLDAPMLASEGPFVRHLVMGLKSEGQNVTFIVPHGVDLSDLPTLGTRILSYRWNRWEKLPVLQKLRLNAVARTLNDSPADVLVAWGSADAGMLQVMSQIVPTLPLVLWCWEAGEISSTGLPLKNLRHYVVSSDVLANRAREAAEVPATVIHPGVYGDDTLACFDVDGQMPCLVSLDPLSDRAAYEALLRACRMIADAGAEFLLFAYNAGTEDSAIWQLAQQLKLLDRVSFVPFQQDAEPLLLHGDLYIHILPSTRVQYRTLEAMGRGLAIVTCPNHGADYLVDGQTCRIVGPPTPEAWRDVLLELLRDRTKATDIARRGQQFVREHHSMGRTLEQFGSICRQASGMAIPLGAAGGSGGAGTGHGN